MFFAVEQILRLGHGVLLLQLFRTFVERQRYDESLRDPVPRISTVSVVPPARRREVRPARSRCFCSPADGAIEPLRTSPTFFPSCEKRRSLRGPARGRASRDPTMRAYSLRSTCVCQRLFADELRLGELERPGFARLHGRNLFGELVAVERHAGFETQYIACAEPAGDQTPSASCAAQQLLPELRRAFAVNEELEAVFAGVAGTREKGGNAVDVGAGAEVVTSLRPDRRSVWG